MRRLFAYMTIFLLATSASGQLWVNENVATVDVTQVSGGMDSWYWNWSGFATQTNVVYVMNGTNAVDLTANTVAFKVSRVTDTGKIAYINWTNIAITASNVSWTIPNTNIPPDDVYVSELWTFFGATTNMSATIGQGQIQVYDSLYDDDDATYPWPATTQNLADYLQVSAVFGGDVTGTYKNLIITNVSGFTVVQVVDSTAPITVATSATTRTIGYDGTATHDERGATNIPMTGVLGLVEISNAVAAGTSVWWGASEGASNWTDSTLYSSNLTGYTNLDDAALSTNVALLGPEATGQEFGQTNTMDKRVLFEDGWNFGTNHVSDLLIPTNSVGDTLGLAAATPTGETNVYWEDFALSTELVLASNAMHQLFQPTGTYIKADGSVAWIGTDNKGTRSTTNSGGTFSFSDAATIRMETADGTDNDVLYISGGGGQGYDRGGQIEIYGNETTSEKGYIVLQAGSGNAGASRIEFRQNNNLRGYLDGDEWNVMGLPISNASEFAVASGGALRGAAGDLFLDFAGAFEAVPDDTNAPYYRLDNGDGVFKITLGQNGDAAFLVFDPDEGNLVQIYPDGSMNGFAHTWSNASLAADITGAPTLDLVNSTNLPDAALSANVAQYDSNGVYTASNNYMGASLTVTNPATDWEAAPRSYVDQAAANANLLEYFHGGTTSDIVSGYYSMTNALGGASEVTNTVNAITNGQYVFSYIAASNVITSIKAGQIMNVHFHAFRTGTGLPQVSLTPELYAREPGGAETNEIEAGTAITLTASEAEYDAHISITNDVTVTEDGYLVVKLKASGVNGSVNAHLITEGVSASRAEFPLDAQNYYNVFGDTLQGAMNVNGNDLVSGGDAHFTNGHFSVCEADIYTNADGLVNIDNTVFVTNGNVGIGTNTPVHPLSVVGIGQFVDQIYAHRPGGNTPMTDAAINFDEGFSGFRGGTAHDFNIDVYNSGSQRAAFTILQGGNVGIGTNDPDTVLELDGALTLNETSEPADPADGKCVLWFSNGTGAGNDGDLLIKRTVSGTVTTNTIDWSAL